MSPSPLPHSVFERLEDASVVDSPAKAVGKAVRSAVAPGAVKDALSGTWLGHALHPMLTDVVIGTWTSAVLLDLVGGRDSDRAAGRLIAIGLASTPPTLATGWNDWADTEPASDAVRRVGFVHAITNATGVAAMTASLVARRNGRTGRGKLLSLAGLGAVGLGGWIGGHLSYALGVGVDTTALEKDVTDWSPTLAETSLREGEPAHALVDGTAVVLVRQNGRIHALADRCAHRGGPLHQGEVGSGTITCPVHGSCFRLEDGSVERGPSAYPQPVFETRVINGTVEVRTAKGRSFVAAA
jgi:nitrite reductase/ring-hydroxylating ferredoxin subunit/uncharacterized membrane protein